MMNEDTFPARTSGCVNEVFRNKGPMLKSKDVKVCKPSVHLFRGNRRILENRITAGFMHRAIMMVSNRT